MKARQKIGFIGQGWIGKNYADDFVERGYDVVRYDLEKFKRYFIFFIEIIDEL